MMSFIPAWPPNIWNLGDVRYFSSISRDYRARLGNTYSQSKNLTVYCSLATLLLLLAISEDSESKLSIFSFSCPAAGTVTRTTATGRKIFTTQRSRWTWTASQRGCPTSRPPPQPRSALRPPSHRRSPTSLILKTSMWTVSRTMPRCCSASQLPLHSATSAPTTPIRYARVSRLMTALR